MNGGGEVGKSEARLIPGSLGVFPFVFVFVIAFLFLFVKSPFFMPEIRKCNYAKSRYWALLMNLALILMSLFSLKVQFSVAQDSFYLFTASFPFALYFVT